MEIKFKPRPDNCPKKFYTLLGMLEEEEVKEVSLNSLNSTEEDVNTGDINKALAYWYGKLVILPKEKEKTTPPPNILVNDIMEAYHLASPKYKKEIRDMFGTSGIPITFCTNSKNEKGEAYEDSKKVKTVERLLILDRHRKERLEAGIS